MHGNITHLRKTLLVVAALCAAVGPVCAQDWKAHRVPLFVSASHPSGHQGFVRVINRSDEAGEVLIDAVDDEGVPIGPVILSIGAGETVHFNSGDLEEGNPEKGLARGIAAGSGDWRLRLRSQLDLEVLAYNRTSDGLLAPLHDLVPSAVVHRPSTGEETMGHRVAIFNPASNVNQVSRLRIVNRGEEMAAVAIEGIDDDGASPGTAVELEVPARASRTVTSKELESGEGDSLTGMLDDGRGKWQLVVTADEPVEVMSLLTSPTGHLTNLSSEPKAGERAATAEHEVALFAAAANPDGYQGFVRIINRSDEAGEVSVEAVDDAGMSYGPVTLGIDANETVHFNSGDLEQGNADKGLVEDIGEGIDDWRLTLRSGLDIEVLAYNRTHDGLLTTLHDLVPYTEVVRPGGAAVEGHYVAIFNPASNENQASRLRVINPGEAEAVVTIEGIDDTGASPGGGVRLAVPAGASRTLTSQALESGQWDAGVDARGSLGDGKGKWRLVVTSDQTIQVMSLLSSPTGHLVNLSTAAPAGAVVPPPVGATHEALEITGRSTASVGTPVALSVQTVGMSEVAVERYEWVFTDGQRERGEEVSVRFAEAGVQEVTVSAMSGTDVVAQATAAVAVFGAASGANPGFEGIPTLFGDVNRDGAFGQEDADLAERAIAGGRDLDVEALDAADVDLSGGLGERDVELMRQALDDGAALPSALLDAYAYPGGVVAMVSPALQDPDTDVEVFVDGEPSAQVMRAILGYATFAVSPSLTGEDAVVEVVVEVDGVVVERLPLLLKPAVMPTASAKEDVLAFLAELAELAAGQEAAGADFLAQNGGLSADETAIVLGAAKAAAQQLQAARAELKALLDGEGGAELAALMQGTLYANGLAEFRTQARAAARAEAGRASSARTSSEAAASVSDICDTYVPAICWLKRSNGALSIGSNAVTALCSLGGLAGIGTANPLLIAGVAKFCLPTLAVLEVARIMGLFVDSLILDMRLSSDMDVLRDGETATIKTEVTFAGLLKLCGSLGKISSSGTVVGRLVTSMVRVLLKKSVKLVLVNKLLSAVSSEAFVQKTFEQAVGRALTVTGLDKVFEGAAKAFCHYVSLGQVSDEEDVVGVTADGGAFNLKASNDVRLLTRKEFGPKDDGSGTWHLACPEGFSGTLVVEGNKDLCGENRNDEVRVACGDPCPGPLDEEVNIPDPWLRGAIVEALYAIGSGPPVTRAKMAELREIVVFPHFGREVRSLAGLECATGLESLSLGGLEITDLTPLGHLSTLVELGLIDSPVQIPNLTLSGLNALQRLLLEGNRIIDLSLSGLNALQRLNLDGNEIIGLSLSDLPALTDLFVHENQIQDLSLSALPALKRLSLFHNQTTGLVVSGLSALTNLDIDQSDQALGVGNVVLSDLPALTTLHFCDAHIADLSLSELASIERLGVVGGTVCDTRISNVTLSGLPALNDLYLDKVQLSRATLSGLPVLTRLSLDYNQISKLSLSGLPAIEDLELVDSQISDLSSLSGLLTLKRLELHTNRIVDVSPLVGSTNLVELDLGGNQIVDLSPLAGLTRLVELDLSLNGSWTSRRSRA